MMTVIQLHNYTSEIILHKGNKTILQDGTLYQWRIYDWSLSSDFRKTAASLDLQTKCWSLCLFLFIEQPHIEPFPWCQNSLSSQNVKPQSLSYTHTHTLTQSDPILCWPRIWMIQKKYGKCIVAFLLETLAYWMCCLKWINYMEYKTKMYLLQCFTN